MVHFASDRALAWILLLSFSLLPAIRASAADAPAAGCGGVQASSTGVPSTPFPCGPQIPRPESLSPQAGSTAPTPSSGTTPAPMSGSAPAPVSAPAPAPVIAPAPAPMVAPAPAPASAPTPQAKAPVRVPIVVVCPEGSKLGKKGRCWAPGVRANDKVACPDGFKPAKDGACWMKPPSKVCPPEWPSRTGDWCYKARELAPAK